MKIAEHHIAYALDHIVEGDTDIFPFPLELRFLKAKREAAIASLAGPDYSLFTPITLVECLIPKTKFGFRVAHQPYPTDTIIFTALVCSIIDLVEEARSATFDERAYSYRKNPGLEKPFFVPDRHFKDWFNSIRMRAFPTGKFTHVIRTDISDFYMRIYRHRLENILESLSGNRPVVKKIEKILSVWRAGQSFGIPVGTDAARLLAEAALHDTDMALMSEGYVHSRYVDDYVIFIKADQDPYAALAFLARHLFENEGLSLNNQKTRIYDWESFYDSKAPIDDDERTKQEWATEKLFWAAYARDESDREALEALMTKDLVQELEAELDQEFWDMGAIRIILHAMRLVGGDDVANYVLANLSKLIPFSKDIFLLIEHFILQGSKKFDNIESAITELVLSDTMRPLDAPRAWFLELGARGLVKFSQASLKSLESLSGTLDIRQMHMLRWQAKDVNFFRSRKARINEIQIWAQPTFIYGARCLPRDEYEHWVRSLRSRMSFPLAKEFCDWCLETYGNEH